MKKDKYRSRYLTQNEKQATPFFIKIVLFLMILMILGLGYKINEKTDFMNQPFITKILHAGNWIPYENWFSYYDHTVSSNLTYHRLTENYFVNGSNQCVTIQDGVVISASLNQVLVLQDNGILTTYGNLEEVLVKHDERILKGTILATFKESITLDFEMNGEKMDYETAMTYS